MSRRLTGRGRRFAGSPLAPVLMLDHGFDVANVTKNGSNQISQVNDLSGNGNHMTQGTAARMIVWVDNGDASGTQDVGLIDTTASFIQEVKSTSTSFFGLGGYTLFIIGKRVSGGAVNTNAEWDLYRDSSSQGGYLVGVRGTSAAGTRVCEMRSDAGSTFTVGFGSYTADTWELWTVRNWGGGANDVNSAAYFDTRVNGATVAWSMIGGANPHFFIPAGASQSAILGTTSTGGTPVSRVARRRLYSGYMTVDQCRVVEEELAALYGITLA